jgi:hypothetical protein
LDEALWKLLEEQGGLCLQIPEIAALDGCSYQEAVIRLPARLYGRGLRSLQENCAPAFLGTLETVLPFMGGPGGICPQLEVLWGGLECWGEEAGKEDRWRRVIASNSSIGREVTKAWGKIRLEAAQAAAWLGEEVPKALGCTFQAIGDGSVTGETRGRLVEARENQRAKVLTKALEEVRPRSTREAWAWKQRDRLSSAWVLALPGPDTALSSAEFSEAAASNLCLPSPACKGRVGETIKGAITIDKYGDKVQATAMKGDHWRSRHDAMLHMLHRTCQWAGLQSTIEVFNLFAGEVRQEGLSRAESNRTLQAMVPDLAITMPAVGVARGGAGVGGGGGTAEGAGERVGAPG